MGRAEILADFIGGGEGYLNGFGMRKLRTRILVSEFPVAT